MELKDADRLREALLKAVMTEEAALYQKDDFGRRFTLDFTMTTAVGKAEIRSLWIILSNEDFPRFISCFIK